MSRLWLLVVLLLACKADPDDPIGPDADGADTKPDGNVHRDGGPSDGGDVPIDALLDVCEEATLHSDLAWIQAHVFTPSCATATCHSGTSADVGLRLDAGQAHGNLVDRGASTQPGWVRVLPGSTTTSYLVVALGRTPGPPPRDGFMPLGADPLCVEKLEAIERWIVEGARP